MMTSAYVLKEISTAQLHVLDNMLQLYVHEMNEYFDYTIVLGNDGRYRIKSAARHLAAGWGYFIVVRGEYAGFILLNHQTKSLGGTFIAEFFILPRFRRGSFYKYVISGLLATSEGIVEYRVIKKNKRALSLFNDLAKRYLSAIQRIDEYENGTEYFRFIFDTANVTNAAEKYEKH